MEYVQAKSYLRWGGLDAEKILGDLTKERPGRTREQTKPLDEGKPSLGGKPGKVTGPGTPVGGERLYTVTDKGGARRVGSAGESTRRILSEGGSRPGRDVARGEPVRRRQYAHAERIYPTGIEAKSARQFAPVANRAALPVGRNALTQHAEPLGQMSLFHVPGAEVNLAAAQQARAERRSSVPPSTSSGRQGILFQPTSFKTL